MGQDLFAHVSEEDKLGRPTRDSWTGTVYRSRNQTYQVLAPELGLDPRDQYGWYALCHRFPGRFIDEGTGFSINARGGLDKGMGQQRRKGSVLRIDPVGRVLIPASLRRTLGFGQRDMLLARAEEGRLVLEKWDHVLARIKSRFAVVPAEVSLVEELVAERRAEAQREL